MGLTPAELGTLTVLALIDSTSVGTLVVPIWLLLSPHGVRLPRMLAYLTTVAVFYLAVGVLLLAGVDLVSDVAGGLADSTIARSVQLVAGVAMLGWALMWKKPESADGPGRLRRWRERMASDDSVRGLLTLALVVTTLELAMMLPYLAAIGTISTAGVAWPIQVGVLAAYCLVMVLPALVLTAVRLAARSRLDPLLARMDDWIARTAGEATAWIVGIVGFMLASRAFSALF